jgi:hypothetical protein
MNETQVTQRTFHSLCKAKWEHCYNAVYRTNYCEEMLEFDADDKDRCIWALSPLGDERFVFTMLGATQWRNLKTILKKKKNSLSLPLK